MQGNGPHSVFVVLCRLPFGRGWSPHEGRRFGADLGAALVWIMEAFVPRCFYSAMRYYLAISTALPAAICDHQDRIIN
jgi:hypothetical protein